MGDTSSLSKNVEKFSAGQWPNATSFPVETDEEGWESARCAEDGARYTSKMRPYEER
jgi:hypothetical protein